MRTMTFSNPLQTMNKYTTLFNDNMSSKQIAIKYFTICDSLEGNDREMLDSAFKEAYLKAEDKELEYAYANSGDGCTYCTQELTEFGMTVKSGGETHGGYRKR